MADKLKLLEELRETVSALQPGQDAERDAWERRTEMIIANLFGKDSKYLKDLAAIHFFPMVYPASEDYKRSSWKNGKERSVNLINTMIEELKLFGESATEAEEAKPNVVAASRDVFVVHGHDEAMKQAVARVLEKLGLAPVILHEQPNKGRTIIEKFTDYSAVQFAVVLLSPDDVAKARNEPSEKLRTRARQNVVFELGYFIGKLGRERVIALYQQDAEFEMPSDYSGVLFVPYDAAGRWQFDLVKELKAAKYEVDANKLV